MINPEDSELHSDQLENDFNPEYVPKMNKKLPFRKPSIKTVLILIFLILSAYKAIELISSLAGNPQLPSSSPILPTPETTYQKTPPPTNLPSQFATDSGLIKVKSKIEDDINYANSVDLSESNLTFPILDFDINFDK